MLWIVLSLLAQTGPTYGQVVKELTAEAERVASVADHELFVNRLIDSGRIIALEIQLMAGPYVLRFSNNESAFLERSQLPVRHEPLRALTNYVYKDRAAAMRALSSRSNPEGFLGCAYYWVGRRVILPTVASPASAPRFYELLSRADEEMSRALTAMGAELDDQAVVMALSVVPWIGSRLVGRLFRRVPGGALEPIGRPSSKILERSLEKVLADPNKLHHIFAKAGRGFEPLLERVGGQEQMIRRVLAELAGVVPDSGVFEQVVVVGGTRLVVRGAVVDGIVRIGTIFLAP